MRKLCGPLKRKVNGQIMHVERFLWFEQLLERCGGGANDGEVDEEDSNDTSDLVDGAGAAIIPAEKPSIG